MKNFAWLPITLFIFCLAACGSFYQEEQKIPRDGQWAYGDTLNFSFTITDTVSHYNFYLDFEHRDTFSCQNVYLKLSTRFPDGHRLTKVRSFDFFDQQGALLGKCSGHTCTLRTVLQENAYFKETGEYVLTVEQNTRIEPLPGINSVGLTLEKLPLPK
ncbi:MAG: gliding motility lipoprotein GldH [Saprospiraceae bacterium]